MPTTETPVSKARLEVGFATVVSNRAKKAGMPVLQIIQQVPGKYIAIASSYDGNSTARSFHEHPTVIAALEDLATKIEE